MWLLRYTTFDDVVGDRYETKVLVRDLQSYLDAHPTIGKDTVKAEFIPIGAQ